ncbi:MAG TPA: hypothetical protein VGD49_05855 [Longimicrobiales bacterium]
MRKRMHSVGMLALALSLAACINTNAVRLGEPGQYPAVHPDSVKVFLTEADVKGEFDKVALINAEGNYSYATDEKMINAMKKKAGKLGANAIILGEFRDPSTVEKIADAVIGVGGEKTAKVLAIRLKL